MNNIEDKAIKMSDALICKLCYDKIISIVFQSCVYTLSCDICAQNLTLCPIYRQNIEKSIRKEDLEWVFTWTDGEGFYHEIDVEYIRNELGRVNNHPRYNVYNFTIMRHVRIKFNLIGEDYSWEVPIGDQDM